MKNTIITKGLFAFTLFVSGSAYSSLVTLTYSNTGSSAETIFTMESDAILASATSGPFDTTGRIDLSSAQHAGSVFDVTDANNVPTAYYGEDINGETYEYRAGNSNNVLQLNTVFGALFQFDTTSNSVTYSGQYNDPITSWTNFSFSGTDFTVDLTQFNEAGFSGFSNGTDFTVDTLNVSVSGVSAVPLPAAAWLFGAGLVGLFSISRRRHHK